MVILYRCYPLEKETVFGLLKIKPLEAYSGCRKELNGLELVIIKPEGTVELVVKGKKETLANSDINKNSMCEVMGIFYSPMKIWFDASNECVESEARAVDPLKGTHENNDKEISPGMVWYDNPKAVRVLFRSPQKSFLEEFYSVAARYAIGPLKHESYRHKHNKWTHAYEFLVHEHTTGKFKQELEQIQNFKSIKFSELTEEVLEILRGDTV